jgi:filamentous hemagglutinin family protein
MVWRNSHGIFNVKAAGASLNDVGVRSRAIVNQLANGNRRIVSDSINSIGSCVDTLLTCPSGIRVKGSSSVNAGRVGSKGAVSVIEITAPFGVHDSCVDSRAIKRSM